MDSTAKLDPPTDSVLPWRLLVLVSLFVVGHSLVVVICLVDLAMVFMPSLRSWAWSLLLPC